MTNQPEQANQQTQHPQELRENMLAQLDASKKAIEELSDTDLETVAGGSIWHTLDRIARTGGDIVGGVAKLTTKVIK